MSTGGWFDLAVLGCGVIAVWKETAKGKYSSGIMVTSRVVEHTLNNWSSCSSQRCLCLSKHNADFEGIVKPVRSQTHLIEILQVGQSSITGPEEAGHALLLSF